jgi:hypothetical protein
MPKLDEEVGETNPFDAHDKAVVQERLKNNHRKMLGQMGILNSTERSQRYENNASQSQSHKNGKFKDPSYEFSQTAGGLRGGTQYFFYSKDGQKYLENLRQRRIGELNAINTGDYSKGPPARIPVEPNTDEIDAVLEKVFDEFESGAFPNAMIDDLNKLRTAFVKAGSTLSASKIAQYVQVMARLKVQVDRIAGVGGGVFQLDANQKKTVRAAGLVMDRLERLLLEINRTVNEPQDVRQRAIAEISSRILGSVSREQAPYGNPEAGRRRRREPPREGETKNDFATRGELENRERRLPLSPEDASLTTPAGEQPVRPF